MLVFLGSWFVCGLFAYGITFAYFQNEYPLSAKMRYRDHLSVAAVIGAMGMFGLVVALIMSAFGKHGLKFF